MIFLVVGNYYNEKHYLDHVLIHMYVSFHNSGFQIVDLHRTTDRQANFLFYLSDCACLCTYYKKIFKLHRLDKLFPVTYVYRRPKYF